MHSSPYLLLLAIWLLLVGCTGEGELDAGTDGAFDARVCETDLSRDVSVLWVMQNQYDSVILLGDSDPLLVTLVEQLRARFTGRLRFAFVNGHINPADVRGTGCIGPEGTGDVFHTGTGPSGEVVGPVVVLEPGGDVAEARSAFGRIALAYRDDNCSNQLLESALRALAPDSLGLAVPHGSVRGDHENAGFVEPGDLLLILFVTNLDDCSWNERVEAGSWINCPDGEPLWCCEAVLFPVQRYIDAYRALGPALGVDLVFATMSAAGVADRSLEEWRDEPWPLCSRAAFYGVPFRLLEVGEALSPNATSQPLCPLLRAESPIDEVTAVLDRLEAASCR